MKIKLRKGTKKEGRNGKKIRGKREGNRGRGPIRGKTGKRKERRNEEQMERKPEENRK